MTTVLVTGGAGFLGSHVVDHLVDAGYDVTVVDNLTEQVHDGEPDHLNPAVDYVWGDVRDRELMTELLSDADVLSHQAGAVGVGQSMYEIEHYVDVNTLGTARLLDIVVNGGLDLEKIVVASSMSIYGEGAYHCDDCGEPKHPGLRDDEQLANGKWELVCPDCGSKLTPAPTPETKPLESNSVYAVTKKDQEQLTLGVARAYDIPAVALRYFNAYGSRQALDNPYTGVCAIFSSRIKNDNPPLVFEDGEQSRDFVHVADIARANRLAIEEDAADGRAVNVGTGDPTTIREIAEVLIDLYGKAESLEPEVTNDFRAGDIRHCFADITRARDLLGFEPQVGLEEGMRELVEWGHYLDADDQFEQAHDELAERGLLEGSE